MLSLENPVNSLGAFIERVSEFRQLWGLPKHKELWFRGESRDYGETILRPELYRPPSVGAPLKPVRKLLSIENDLYEEFQRIAVERCNEKTSEEDWVWDSYFLMQQRESSAALVTGYGRTVKAWLGAVSFNGSQCRISIVKQELESRMKRTELQWEWKEVLRGLDTL